MYRNQQLQNAGSLPDYLKAGGGRYSPKTKIGNDVGGPVSVTIPKDAGKVLKIELSGFSHDFDPTNRAADGSYSIKLPEKLHNEVISIRVICENKTLSYGACTHKSCNGSYKGNDGKLLLNINYESQTGFVDLMEHFENQKTAMHWKAGTPVDPNDFMNRFENRTASSIGKIGENISTNCWEIILLAMLQAGQITAAQLESVYAIREDSYMNPHDNGMSFETNVITLLGDISNVAKVEVSKEQMDVIPESDLQVARGTVIVMNRYSTNPSGADTLYHVVVATGNGSEVLSFGTPSAKGTDKMHQIVTTDLKELLKEALTKNFDLVRLFKIPPGK